MVQKLSTKGCCRVLNTRVIINVIYTISVIICCLLIGKVIENYITILPASLYGMLLFSLLLASKIVSANKVKNTANWVINNMGVCFVPAGIGVMQYTALIKSHGLLLVIIIVSTTFILLTMVGYFYQQYLNKNDIN